jgi:hypothetical protein
VAQGKVHDPTPILPIVLLFISLCYDQKILSELKDFAELVPDKDYP